MYELEPSDCQRLKLICSRLLSLSCINAMTANPQINEHLTLSEICTEMLYLTGGYVPALAVDHVNQYCADNAFKARASWMSDSIAVFYVTVEGINGAKVFNSNYSGVDQCKQWLDLMKNSSRTTESPQKSREVQDSVSKHKSTWQKLRSAIGMGS